MYVYLWSTSMYVHLWSIYVYMHNYIHICIYIYGTKDLPVFVFCWYLRGVPAILHIPPNPWFLKRREHLRAFLPKNPNWIGNVDLRSTSFQSKSQPPDPTSRRTVMDWFWSPGLSISQLPNCAAAAGFCSMSWSWSSTTTGLHLNFFRSQWTDYIHQHCTALLESSDPGLWNWKQRSRLGKYNIIYLQYTSYLYMYVYVTTKLARYQVSSVVPASLFWNVQ